MFADNTVIEVTGERMNFGDVSHTYRVDRKIGDSTAGNEQYLVRNINSKNAPLLTLRKHNDGLWSVVGRFRCSVRTHIRWATVRIVERVAGLPDDSDLRAELVGRFEAGEELIYCNACKDFWGFEDMEDDENTCKSCKKIELEIVNERKRLDYIMDIELS